MHRLAQYVDQLVNVTSKPLFGDTGGRECRLISVEDIGLWLQSAELTGAMRADVKGNDNLLDVPVFVPYAQVLCVTPVTVRIAAWQAPHIRESILASREARSASKRSGTTTPDRAKPRSKKAR